MATAKASMTDLGLARPSWLKKTLIFVLFFVVESAAFAILPLSSGLLPKLTLRTLQIAVTAVLLVVALLMWRSERGKPYRHVFYAFFVGSLAVLLSSLYAGRLVALFGFTDTNPPGMAVAKFCESLWRVPVILVAMGIVGVDRRSLYLQKGRLGLGLAVGFAGFVVMAALGFLPVAGRPGGMTRLLSLLPWILLFVLCNGFTEELLFRGLFLKRYEPLLGKGLSLLLTAIVFTLLHVQVGYVPSVTQFLVQLFPLALLWGWLMQKTDSLWGSALFHAGADCVIIFGIFASI